MTKKDLPTSLHPQRTPFKSLFVNDIFISHVYGQRCSFTHLIYIGVMPLIRQIFVPHFLPSFFTLIFDPQL